MRGCQLLLGLFADSLSLFEEKGARAATHSDSVCAIAEEEAGVLRDRRIWWGTVAVFAGIGAALLTGSGTAVGRHRRQRRTLGHVHLAIVVELAGYGRDRSTPRRTRRRRLAGAHPETDRHGARRRQRPPRRPAPGARRTRQPRSWPTCCQSSASRLPHRRPGRRPAPARDPPRRHRSQPSRWSPRRPPTASPA